MSIKKLPNFINFCMTIGEIPSSYKISLTYEEQILWLCNFLENTVIPVVNNNSKVTEELKYYLENLDIQDEINEKLEEMAQSGELTEIISAYINLKSLLTFKTLEDLKQSDYLIEGSIVKTLNYYENNGGGAFYKVRQIENTDNVDNCSIISLLDVNLIAEIIVENEINVKQFGAKGDGVTDDANAIQKTIDFANNKNLIVIFDKSNYKINSTINIIGNNQTLKCYGTLYSEEEINIINTKGILNNIYIHSIKSKENKSNGIRIDGFTGYCNINIDQLKLLNYGIYINPNDNGVQYNKINILNSNCNINILLKAENHGWINQNTFNGGHLGGNYGIYTDATDDTIDHYNGNHYINFGFEQIAKPLHLEKCIYSEFENFRMFENITGNDFIYLDNKSYGNLFKSKETNMIKFSNINDNNSLNIPNVYDIVCINNSGSVRTPGFYILDKLPYLKDGTNANIATYINTSDTVIETNIQAFSRTNIFKTDLTPNLSHTLNLDKRYKSNNPFYSSFLFEIGFRGNLSNFIINVDGTKVFELQEQIAGDVLGNINKVFRISKKYDGWIIEKLN